MKITIRATADQLRNATAAFKRAGEIADNVSKSASDTATIASDTRKARAPLRMMAVNAFGNLLERLFGH